MSYTYQNNFTTQHNEINTIDEDTFDTRISNDEKEELVAFSEKKEGIGKFKLIQAFLIISLIMGIFIPKIFVSNNIYYTSREIARLHAEKELLYEEKMRLQREVEIINNKHLMLELGAQ